MQSAKTLQGFGLDEFGIQFMKPNTSFASRVKRFQGLNEVGGVKKDDDQQLPGPGQYYKEATWGKNNMRNSMSHQSKTGGSTATAQILLPNPPSIPSHNNVFGYEENARGELIR